MTRFDPTHASLASLQDSVVVLTGGASGIGAATVRLLHSHGARVVFGDLDASAAESVVSSTSADTIHFIKTDVRDYQANLTLFKFALERYGRVDHAIANAGLVETQGWFNPQTGIDGVEQEPSLKTLDVNLRAVLYFAHIACPYLAHGNDDNGEKSVKDKSLTLLSSIAGWKESPGLFVYQASKFGVMGLLKTLRPYVPAVYSGVRVNAVCPGMTETRMVEGIRQGYLDAGLPPNRPEDVGSAIVALCRAAPHTKAIWYDEAEAPGVRSRSSVGAVDWQATEQTGVTGRAIFVLGGQCYDIEEGLDRTESLWLGNKASVIVKKAQDALGQGTEWVKS